MLVPTNIYKLQSAEIAHTCNPGRVPNVSIIKIFVFLWIDDL